MNITATRKICDIASDIIMDMEAIAKAKGKYWRNMFPYCEQQLEAMMSLEKVTDKYIFEDGFGIVCSALSNMNTYKGANAKKYKNELRVLVGLKPTK